MTALLRTAIGVIVLALAGCGGDTTDVSGKVTYMGKPVMFGTVQVIGSDGVPKSGPIQPDGTFRVSGVKLGPAKVMVSSPPPPGSAAAAPKGRGARDPDDDRRPADADTPVSPEVAQGWFPIPEKYAHPDKTDLSMDIRAGQPLEIELK
jgi:hypothetical protein